jgi:hypothetical protein
MNINKRLCHRDNHMTGTRDFFIVHVRLAVKSRLWGRLFWVFVWESSPLEEFLAQDCNMAARNVCWPHTNGVFTGIRATEKSCFWVCTVAEPVVGSLFSSIPHMTNEASPAWYNSGHIWHRVRVIFCIVQHIPLMIFVHSIGMCIAFWLVGSTFEVRVTASFFILLWPSIPASV